jgi:hypothetical protein
LSGLRGFGSTKPSEINDFLPFAAPSLAFDAIRTARSPFGCWNTRCRHIGKPLQINVCLNEKAKFSGAQPHCCDIARLD